MSDKIFGFDYMLFENQDETDYMIGMNNYHVHKFTLIETTTITIRNTTYIEAYDDYRMRCFFTKTLHGASIINEPPYDRINVCDYPLVISGLTRFLTPGVYYFFVFSNDTTPNTYNLIFENEPN